MEGVFGSLRTRALGTHERVRGWMGWTLWPHSVNPVHLSQRTALMHLLGLLRTHLRTQVRPHALGFLPSLRAVGICVLLRACDPPYAMKLLEGDKAEALH